MSSKIYNCSLCLYKSDLKYNFNRHMVLKHTNNKDKNTTDNIKNTTDNVKNTTDNVKNTTNNVKNTASDTKCVKCNKIMSSKNYLQKHLIICKGVSNVLECHLCHKILANSGSKCRHLKTCKGESSLELILTTNNINSNNVNNGTITTTNNINNINNGSINNGSINTNNTANITNIIVFDPSNTNGTTLKTDHIDLDFISSLLKKKENDALFLYIKKLLDNPDNRCIRKTNLRSIFSEIHVGNNKWDSCYDKDIYPKILSEFSNCFGDLLTTKVPNKKIINKLLEFIDYIAEDGYCNNEEIKDEIRNNYKTLIQKTKTIFYNITK
jgi:hypothetical protein